MADKLQALIVNNKDNVATAITNLRKGEEVIVPFESNKQKFILLDDIPLGHKFSLKDMHKGTHIIKYGEIIGLASTNISAGAHVHIHNVMSTRGRGDLAEGSL
jgi:altronate dehydratase small subunit